MDYNARYYNPRLGRFISPDSIVPEPGSSQGFNRYRYTRNNPLKYTDPSGHCIWDLCILEIAGVSIGVVELTAFGATAYGAYKVGTSDVYQDALAGAIESIPSAAPSYEPLPGYGEGELNRPDPGGYHPGPPLGGEFTGPLQLPSPGELQQPTYVPGFSLDPGVLPSLDLSVSTKNPGIYEFPDLKNPGQTYVGQSGNIEGRLKGHKGRYEPGSTSTTSIPNSTKLEREIAEQNRINELGGIRGGAVSNQRNPIGPARREEAEKQGLKPFDGY